MIAMSDEEMDVYLKTRQWANNSGAYAILEEGDPHLSVVEGTVSNVIGLPMETTLKVLHWLSGEALPPPPGSA
jgi:septum formation protein